VVVAMKARVKKTPLVAQSRGCRSWWRSSDVAIGRSIA
jgi:hypothetical protein